ncbi:MAG: FAD-binding oxidoreductase [Rhodobacteraceae bacterium]|nr:FAD-binding oxidoreductase [Paracoccaceae bacterium]
MTKSVKQVTAGLVDLLGSARVISDPPALAYYGTDISGEGTHRPVLAIKPDTVDHLCRAVALVTGAGVAVIPRGGGYSYTQGYVPAVANAAVIDVSDLNRIVEINEADRYVTVEAGCTWSALFEALKAKKLRTPFFGTLSGSASTVGGAASNNAQFFGSGAYGTMSDVVQSLDVVVADGRLVETGSAAAEGRTPFFRHFGPDFTGLFLGDGGAFGIKARVTLPLIALPAAEGYVSFAFERFEDIAEAHVALAREDVAAEQWGIDPEGNESLAKRGFTFLEGLAMVRDVAEASKPAGGALKSVAKMLVDGHRAVLRTGWSLHAVVEAASEREVETKLGKIRRVLMPMALKELPNTIPQVTRAKPFRAIKQLLGPDGRNWLPVHGLFPLSRAAEVAAVTDEYFVRHREIITRHGISVSYLTGTVGNAFTLEPMFFWKDRLHAFHLKHATSEQVQAFAGTPPNPAAREAVMTLRNDLALLWGAYGAIHMQVGKFYPYVGTLSSASAALATSIKTALDPNNLMNPGALGLGLPKGRKVSEFTEFPQDLLAGE